MKLSHRMENDILVLSVEGGIFSNVSTKLSTYIHELLEKQKTDVIILNCSKVINIDSSGLSVFIKFFKKFREKTKFVFCELDENLFEKFERTCLNRLFPIYPTEQEVLTIYKKQT